MKVRAVTVGAPLGAPPGAPARSALIARAGALASAVADAIKDAGYEVQTLRLATPPLNQLLEEPDAGAVLRLAEELERAARAAGFGYVALGAVDTFQPGAERLLDAVPDVIGSTEAVFCAASVASRADGINLAAVRACGTVVARVAGQTPDGFGNLRFAALANCPPHIPFFPAAYHDARTDLTVGIALEAADLAVSAFASATSLDAAQSRLCTTLASSVRHVASAVQRAIAGQTGVELTGVDLSLAPFPADDRSIAAAFEHLGLPAFGGHGTLFLASFLTDCLRAVARDTGQVERVGFSGLMLPVLEDSVLAARAAEGTFGVDRLLLYSSVCGLGLDTVPLPGDTPPELLGAIILDMATLAVKLDKPLTARLFPVPGKRAGDPVAWDFAFFSPSRVLPARGRGPSGVLATALTYAPPHGE